MSDSELLQSYARGGAETALATLIERHLDLVYSVARRHVASSQVAEDVAQSVFIELARNARRIEAGTPLVAWLHVVSRRIAINAARGEARRHARERAAAEIATMKSPPPPWEAIAPLLDEAVESLPAPDRAAILLRYFENKKLRDVGAALGLSDDAAQKRVSRSLEQLRAFLLHRGVAVTAAGLATDLSAHALSTAPAALGPLVATAAAGATPHAALSAAATLTMTTAQKCGVAAAMVAAAVTVYEASVIYRQHSALESAQVHAAALAGRIDDLRAAKKKSADLLALAQAQLNARLTQAVDAASAAPGDAALESQMNAWLAQLDRLKNFLTERPNLSIPELQFLADEHWFAIAANGKLESDEDYRRACAGLRNQAESIFAGRISKALFDYTRANNDQLPVTPQQLAPYFYPAIDPSVLERYQMLQQGKAGDVPARERNRIIAARTPVDIEYDVYHWAGLNGYGNNGSMMDYNLGIAQTAFRRAHSGEDPGVAARLLPYLKWPVDVVVLQKYMDRQKSGGSR